MVDAFATLNVVDLLVDDDLTVTDDVAIGGLATVGGTLGVTGIATFTDDIIIGDGKTIGSASDVDAMSISSGGVVNFSARPTFAASLTIQDGGSLGSASDLNAMTISSGGVVAVTATTASSSSTTGALTVGGGLGVAADLFVGDDLTVTGDLDVDGAIEFDSLSGTGSVAITDILDEDNLASDSATKLATQQSIKAYVDANTGGTLTEVLSNGNRTTAAEKIEFRDAAIFINSSADGQLDIVADTEIQIAATTIDINGALALNSTITGATNITLSGELDAATGDFSGAVDIAGALDVHGAVGLAETTTVATNKKIQFRDSAIHISSTADGDLSIAADDEIDLTSTLIDVNGVLNVNGLLQTTSNVELLQGRHVRFLSGAGATIRASISAESNDNLQFNTGSSETARMTIDTDGNVGINTTSPTGYHNVNGNSAVNNIGYNLTFGGVGGGQSGEVYGVKIAAQSNNNGGATYGVFSQAGQGVGGNTCGVYGDNHVSSLTQNSGARSIGVWGQCINNSGANGGSPYLANAQIKAGVLGMVTQINSSSAVTNAAVVANNLATSAALAYGVAIHTTAGPNAVRGLEYDHNGTVVLLIASTGNVTNANNSYGAISDLKLKENISVASSQWDDVKAIQVKKYSLKSDNLSSANQLGVIAQDLEASGMGGLVENDVMPITGEDGIVDPTQTETTKQVKYSVLYMKAVKALQEAMIRIEALETKVTALENA